MKKSIFALSLMTMALFANEEFQSEDLVSYHIPNRREKVSNSVIIPQLKGIVLTSNPNNLRYVDDSVFLQSVDLKIPGGYWGLEDQLKCFCGYPLTQDSIKAIEELIILYYQEHKRPLIVLEIPKQDTSTGVLYLVVRESRLGKIEAQGANWFSNEAIARRVRLQPGDVVDERLLMADITWLNRDSFRRTDLVYTPGIEPYTTDLELLSCDRFPLRTFSGIDNTGIETVGENRFFVGVNWAMDKYLLDHQLTYQYTASLDFHKFQSHTVHYTAPLSWRHIFIAFGAYSTVHANHLGDHFSNEGWAAQASGRYVFPLPSGKHLTQDVRFGFDWKRTNNDVLFTEIPVFGQLVNISQFMMEYSLAFQSCNSDTSFHTEINWSPGQMLSDQSKDAFESLRPGASVKYVYLRAALAEQLKMPGDFLFIGRFTGQVSNRALLPSEQLGMGGYNTVRGYEERIANGDDGIVTSGEIRTPNFSIFQRCRPNCWQNGDALQFLWFVDYGFAFNHHPAPGEPKFEYLFSSGPGLRYNWNPYASVRLDYGMKMHDVPGDHSFGRVHFSFVAGY